MNWLVIWWYLISSGGERTADRRPSTADATVAAVVVVGVYVALLASMAELFGRTVFHVLLWGTAVVVAAAVVAAVRGQRRLGAMAARQVAGQ